MTLSMNSVGEVVGKAELKVSFVAFKLGDLSAHAHSGGAKVGEHQRHIVVQIKEQRVEIHASSIEPSGGSEQVINGSIIPLTKAYAWSTSDHLDLVKDSQRHDLSFPKRDFVTVSPSARFSYNRSHTEPERNAAGEDRADRRRPTSCLCCPKFGYAHQRNASSRTRAKRNGSPSDQVLAHQPCKLHFIPLFQSEAILP